VIYWLVGVRASTAEFLIATDGEMKKVNWSTRKGVIDSTWVVILWSVVLAGGLFVIDGLFAQAFKLIGVLE
jgi:preprotein translocase SecE subunit